MTLYKIIRFHKSKPNKEVRWNLTLEEAQEHCSNPATAGKNWFDGYTKQ